MSYCSRRITRPGSQHAEEGIQCNQIATTRQGGFGKQPRASDIAGASSADSLPEGVGGVGI